jgi:hypothetical protein
VLVWRKGVYSLVDKVGIVMVVGVVDEEEEKGERKERKRKETFRLFMRDAVRQDRSKEGKSDERLLKSSSSSSNSSSSFPPTHSSLSKKISRNTHEPLGGRLLFELFNIEVFTPFLQSYTFFPPLFLLLLLLLLLFLLLLFFFVCLFFSF